MMDNPNNQHLSSINKYVKAMDSRLSIPKFDPDRQSVEILRRSPQGRKSNLSLLPRQNSTSPEMKSPMNRKNDPPSSKLKSFLNQGLNEGSVMKLPNVAESPSLMKSQNDRQLEMKQKLKYYKQKVNQDDKDALFSGI